MENYKNPAAQIDANARPVKESRWKRIHNEVNGRSQRYYKHQMSPLLCKSYAEIGRFPHVYPTWQAPCRTHYSQITYDHALDRLYSGDGLDVDALNGAGFGYGSVSILFKLGVSALEFDSKGTNLASVTRSGCVTVHKSESLCSHRNGSTDPLKHFPLFDLKFDSIKAVRWNPSNQNEIACASFRSTQLRIIDIEQSREVQVLWKSSDRETEKLSDIAFLNDGMRVLASDIRGAINMWDRRTDIIPQRLLTTKKITGLTSIQILGDHCVYGAATTGFIYVWDLRRMRSSPAASLNDREIHSIPLTSIDLEYLLKQINPRKTRRDHRPKELHAININPSCPYQLAFHLDNGWSGVVDTHNYQVSHIHCPQFPIWLDNYAYGRPISCSRKPAWLPEHSIYAAPSTSRKGLHLLDFHPHPSSPCHVDYEDAESPVLEISKHSSHTNQHPDENAEDKRSIFVSLSKNVTACAVHPLNGTIVAGALDGSLLTVSQKHIGKKGDGDNDHDVEQSGKRLDVEP